jgi:drug/metabolite transporter (DMT)-like permease
VEHKEDASPILLEYPRPAVSPIFVAIGALVLCCMFWGYSFPVMQFATRAFDRHVLNGGAGEWDKFASRALFNGVRFGLAAALYAGVTWRRQRGFSRHEVVGGVVVGSLFAMGMLLQVTALRWVLPSVSGFFTALPVVFAPLAQSAIFKRAVGAKTWVAVVLAIIGIILLSWPKPEASSTNTVASAPPVAYLGEMLTVLAALVFTAEIIAVHHFGQRADPVRLTLVMLATTSVLSLGVSFALGGPQLFNACGIAGSARDWELIWTMVTLIVISSVLPLHMMNTFQPRVSPAIASVIYCTEPLFATLFSLILATERLTSLTIAGGVAVVASVLVVARQGGAKDEKSE